MKKDKLRPSKLIVVEPDVAFKVNAKNI